ncbi:extracellular solute-binding protein [Bordetella genomosp. 9]|uniref:sn-glycerol-3-phosphate-binding periplasmic protein UgpB n=1 Tax=Bordetella genomosp. 9 TaxID=1416803 RepID=A0A1W6Z1I8_9BORD|nr:extracellular solute-binding protein [Bordetella genomosp. 9]ARP87210.1 glycerol-3-phosphate ABC transporter substrate-binding protein [Bordetella genomosp. 9]
MKKLHETGLSRAIRASGRVWIFGAAMLAAGVAHAAPVQIQVWHALTDVNKAEFEKLVKQYNKEQNDVEVSLRDFDSPVALQQAARSAVASKKTPNLIQLQDNHSPEVVAEYKSIKPLYELLAKYPIKDATWFLPSTTSFTRDSRGRLLAFPYMAEIPVMFYNTALYKKAGLNPNAPARTWADLQGELLKLRDGADVECPYASADQVEVHLENLAPINNQLYTSNGNGIEAQRGKAAPASLEFDTLYMRHISLMTSWKRSLLLTQHSNDDKPVESFAKGQCGVLTASSGVLGRLLNTKSLSFGIAPLPYYEQATKQPGKPFVSGSALWVMEGHPAAQDKATAEFLAWLSKPVTAAEWHQSTGYLPLTEAAFRAAQVSFYKNIPGAQEVVANMRAQPPATARGFRVANYDRIEPVLNRELDQALDGKTPPVAALTSAVSQARAIAQQR